MASRGDEPEMNLREWDRKARLLRENPISRRFSASYIGSFREDNKFSSRTIFNNNISSTASSPGYSLKEEIDPSTYSFTSALKALQAKTMYNNKEWGFELNSKWNEAEKYICNPLSGEVPMECLSAKTLSARSFRNLNSMSAPLHNYNFSNSNLIKHNNNNNNSVVKVIHEDLYAPDHVINEEKKVVGLKRDVGIQSSNPVDVSSGSPSPAKTPPIMERSLKRHVEVNDSPVDYNLKLESQQEGLKDVKLEEKEDEEEENEEEEKKKQKTKKRNNGCFSWLRGRQRQARNSKCIFPICVPHLVKGC